MADGAAESGQITRLLMAHEKGDREALRRLVPLIYKDLKRLARFQLRGVRADPGPTLNTTGLVHEAFLKLVDQTRINYESRSHFFNIASRAMRQIIVDYARHRRARKRGGGENPVTLDEERTETRVRQEVEIVLAVDSALARLKAVDERLVRLVECRFFAGLTDNETADTLGVSPRTVQREWARARAWLLHEMQEKLP